VHEEEDDDEGMKMNEDELTVMMMYREKTEA
jgi:hypothetical protein